MSVDSVQNEINYVQGLKDGKFVEINTTEDEIRKIKEAMDNVNTLWTKVDVSGCKNTFNYVKRNCGLQIVDDNGNVTNSDSKNFWVVQNSSGEVCGDIASFASALDGIVAQIDTVSDLMVDVKAKAQEKLNEYTAELSALESDVDALQERLNNLKEQLQQEKIAEEKQNNKKNIDNSSNVDNVF